MNIDECTREPELLDSIQAMQWPELADAELRAHVPACASCSDLVTVATAFFHDYDAALQEAPIPSAGAVWFRAQHRLRADAVRKATRTLYAVQAFSIAAAAIIVIALLSTTSVFTPDWAGFGEQLRQAGATLVSVPASLQWTPAILYALAGTATLAPVALYLAVAKE